MHYIGERDGKTKNIKRRQNKLLTYICSYTQYTWPPSRFIQHLKKLAQMGAGKYVAKLFVREKENRTNKGTVKQCVAAYFINSTTYHYQTLYQISRS